MIESFFSSFGIAGLLYLLLQLVVTVHILLKKEDVKSAIGWLGLIWLAPLLGNALYILFGINRIHRKARHLRRKTTPLKAWSQQKLRQAEKSFPPYALQFLRLGYQVHPQHFTLGNQVTPFLNGDEAYPAMCRLIQSARKEVLLQSYIFNNDAAGQMFLAALREALANGARVKIMVDGVGLNYAKTPITQALQKLPGAEWAVFLPSRKPADLPFVNLRNHRKMLLVDGQTAFFGGMNISQDNLLKTHPQSPVADVTFQVSGPVVEQMAQVFEEDWIFCGKEPFTPAAYTPRPLETSGSAARILPDGPDGDYGKVLMLLLGVLSCAQKSVQIVTPYFLPENDILNALEVAAMRGVNIEIILPQKSNIWGMDQAMRANFERLLSHSIKIYRTPPPFDHSKIVLVDDAWLFVGSANWDVRSFKLNFECNMECMDLELARRVGKIIRHKKETARMEIYPLQRSWWKHLTDNAWRLLTPYY